MVNTIVKSFINYSSEARTEIKELSKLHLLASNGRLKEQKVYLSIKKVEGVEVIVYDLSNFSVNSYNDFNRKIKELIN